jgi:hypothetical protein
MMNSLLAFASKLLLSGTEVVAEVMPERLLMGLLKW